MENKIKKVPGATLKGLRATYGLTIKDMAGILKITENSYSNKENGKRGWKSKEMLKLCHLFKRSSDAIFFEDELSSMTGTDDRGDA